MPRENSFSDSDGRSLTPDLEEEMEAQGGLSPSSPTYETFPATELPGPQSPAHSYPPRARSSTNASRPRPQPHPRDKFRAVVRKVIAMHRSTDVIKAHGVGAEPGVDPRRMSADLQYGGIKTDCVIEVFDYSSVRSSFGRMTNKEFVNLMNDAQASEREPWVKVRWINIGGMSWDVIKAVSLKYNLHPLALEDVFHARSQTRSKADYYSKHLFLRMLCHELGEPVAVDNPFNSPATGSTLVDIPRSSSPLPYTEEDTKRGNGYAAEDEDLDDKTVYGSMPSRKIGTMRRKRRPILPHNRSDLTAAALNEGRTPTGIVSREIEGKLDSRQKRRLEEAALEKLKHTKDRVSVRVTPMFIFLLRDGTVISIHQTPDLEFTKPITNRLHARDTGLRTSADPSLLVQSLLDLIVDRALEVIDQYHAKIVKFEREILVKPDVSTIRNLHILSGDLILHKRTLEPIKTVIYGLRRYDLDRCAAIVDPAKAAQPGFKVVGYMSHKSKIYLADVYDHMEYILSSLDMFAGISENLIDYTFNMKSNEMNEIMRVLTLTTIIILPLTLLTGYFGMNFDPMWSVQQNSDLLFWKIALPVMAVIIPICLMSDIKRAIHYIQKKVIAKDAVKPLTRKLKHS